MAYLVGAPAAGVLVDRLGARRSFAAAIVIWSMVAGAHALVTSFAMLFALRVMLGAAESPSFPSAAQAIQRALPHGRRTAAFGLLFTGSSLGSMIAAPLALSLDGRYGFRIAFAGTAAVGLLWIPFWFAMTRGDRLSRDAAPTQADPGATPGDEAPMGWFAVLRTPAVLRTLLVVFGSAPALMFVLNWSSQYLVEQWHMPKLETRWYLVVPPLFFDLGAVGFGFWASRRDRAPVKKTHVGLIALAAGLASLLVLGPLAPSPLVATAILGVAGAGGAGLYVMATADMLSRVPLGKTSTAGGMTAAAQSLAHIIASPLVGRIVDRTHHYDAAFVTLGLLVVPASLAFVLWPGMRTR
jgi:predicted MFS family arabinose efflux permease